MANDREIWERISCRDADAFAAFYKENAPRLQAFLRHFVGNRQAAEDVTQETFTQVWRRPHGFQPERGTLRAYLYGEFKNRVWSDQKDGPPSIELTAIAILALCAGGENKVTSSRLAVAAFDVADASLAQLVHEREELAGNMQSFVRKEIDQVMIQRDRITKRAEEP